MCLTPTNNHMSVWKSNFFLQTGLPESLPKPPERPREVDQQFAVEHELPPRHVGQRGKDKRPREVDQQFAVDHELPPRHVGQRGKDKFPRRIRKPSLFNFYETMRGIELREADGNGTMTPQQTRDEYHALSKQQRAYWEYMHELFFIFEEQERVADHGLAKLSASSRNRKLWNKFYFLDEPEQQQLVRDYLAHRWEKENYQYVRETCHQDNLRHLVDIRRDLRLLLAKVEEALAPKEM